MSIRDAPLRCLDKNDDCDGPVEWRWPGYGEKQWPRCERHGRLRIAKQREIDERYPQTAPRDFDPSYAGERWDEDA